jgi:hypothetical protein
MSDIREALQASFEQHAPETAETPQETRVEPAEIPQENLAESSTETAREAIERARDELGRFAPKQAETAPVKTPEPVVEARKPPASWKKDYYDHYQKLDPALQEYINQREEEYYRGVGSYKQQAEIGQQFLEATKPYEAHMRSLGVEPVQAFKALANADYTLRTADPVTRANMFAQLAQQYGVNLDDLGSQPIIDPTVQALQREIMSLKQSLNQVQGGFQQQQEQTYQQMITEAAKRLPHFDELRQTMAQIMNAGMAETLEEAHSKALRLTPELFDQVQAQQRQAEEQARLKQQAEAAAKAKATALQVRGGPSTALPDTQRGLRGAIESAWDNHTR